jgi:predicted RNase H-like nuclease (RuvC/YqgF family)
MYFDFEVCWVYKFSFQSELEESYQNLKLENAKLEAEVKHERHRVEMLEKDLNDSQKVTSQSR